MKNIRAALEALRNNLRLGEPDLVYPTNQMDAALNESSLESRRDGGQYLDAAFAELKALEATGITVDVEVIPAKERIVVVLPKSKRGRKAKNKA